MVNIIHPFLLEHNICKIYSCNINFILNSMQILSLHPMLSLWIHGTKRCTYEFFRNSLKNFGIGADIERHRCISIGKVLSLSEPLCKRIHTYIIISEVLIALIIVGRHTVTGTYITVATIKNQSSKYQVYKLCKNQELLDIRIFNITKFNC